jgi:octaprenyl-diphosphate synthase
VNSDRDFIDRFNVHFKEIDKELERGFDSRVPLVVKIGKHSLLGNGKRLRPLLFVLASRLCGYDGKDIYALSTIFEYLHCASLLHDDVIDNADTRRNKPSARNLWGNSAAVLAGDFLTSKAFSIALSTNNLDFLDMIINTGLKMSEGQTLELVHTNDLNLNHDEYLDIIISKTAELMAAACACGGIAAGAGKENILRLKSFGLNIGIAFQIIDDLLDYSASEDELGKPAGKDLKEGKVTLPLIYALPEMDGDDRHSLDELTADHEISEENYGKILSRVKKSCSINKVKEEAEAYVSRAAELLNELPASPYKDDLIFLNDFMSSRKY